MAFAKCAECKGGDPKVCCGDGGAYLHWQEVLSVIRQVDKEIKFGEHEGLFYMKSENGNCPCLGPEGCVLTDKPISCIVWPWLPTVTGGWVMRMTCHHWDTITKEDFEEVKRVFEEKRLLWKNYVVL